MTTKETNKAKWNDPNDDCRNNEQRLLMKTLRVPKKLVADFAEITKKLHYVSFSEHMRELMRYEVVTQGEGRDA